MLTTDNSFPTLIEFTKGTCARFGRRLAPEIQAKVYGELLRIYLSTSLAFQKIRPPQHLFRIAILFYRLLEQLPLKALEPDRFCRADVFRSSLFFPFGKRSVLSLGVLINTLSRNERLDNQHIESACRRLLPNINAIPSSFFTYVYPNENCQVLYLELENDHLEPISTKQILQLKKYIPQYIKESIEKISSYVYLPTNEDDSLRNCALLAEEVHNDQSLPQIMVHYRGEVSECLVFDVTMVRPLSANQAKNPPPLIKSSVIDRSEIVQVTNIEAIDGTHIKQAVILRIYAKKEPFLRCDRSIDFHQARKVVVFCLREFVGNLRDLNGGLLGQQQNLLAEISKALSTTPRYNARVCENIYYSIVPSLHKNLCSAKELVAFFNLFFQMRNLNYCRRLRTILHTQTDAISAYLLIKTPHINSEAILNTAQKLGLQEYEFALAFDTIEDQECIGILIISTNADLRESFREYLATITRHQETARSGKQRIRISLPLDSMQLDPRISTERPTGTIINLLYEGLFRLSRTGKLSAGLAENVRTLDRGRTYVFTLRPSVWSNGIPVTAMDFEYAWKKILAPDFRTYFGHLFSAIQNAEEAKRGLVTPSEIGITSASERELVVKLKYPEPHFPEACSHWMFSPVCQAIDQKNPSWANLVGSNFVCNGPFTPDYWSPKGDVRVVKNYRFWNERAINLEEIEICVLEDNLMALQQFNKGALDWIGDPLSDIPADILAAGAGTMYNYPINALFWFEFDCTIPPFTSKRVRKAFSHAINRQKIVSSSQGSHDKVAVSILPENLSLFPNSESLQFNIDLARRLFEEGLAEQNLEKASLNPIKICIPETRNHEEITKQAIEMWSHAFHIPIVLDKRPMKGFFDLLHQTQPHILGRRWCLWNQDPFYTLEELKKTQKEITISRWDSDHFTELVDRAKEESLIDKKTAFLKQAESCALDEMPIVPIVEYIYHYKKNENLHNVYPSSMDDVDFSYAQLRQQPYETITVKPFPIEIKQGMPQTL